jgi:uncharacterized protein
MKITERKEPAMKRRNFLKGAAVTTLSVAAEQLAESIHAVLSAADPDTAGHPGDKGAGAMLYHTLGRTGETISAIGLGGFHWPGPAG